MSGWVARVAQEQELVSGRVARRAVSSRRWSDGVSVGASSSSRATGVHVREGGRRREGDEGRYAGSQPGCRTTQVPAGA